MAIVSKERKVGEVFTLDGKQYKVFQDDCDSCRKCIFYNGGAKFCTERVGNIIGKCSQENRADHIPVYFLEVSESSFSSTIDNKKKLLLLV